MHRQRFIPGRPHYMSRIIYLPFEPLPQRYTEMWNDAIESNLLPSDIIVKIPQDPQIIKNGEFLDTYGTVSYKSRQIAKVAELFQAGKVKDGDCFFVPDIFYPGLESLRYMSELSGIEIKIASFNHAGRADEWDFVQTLNDWADKQEQAWHDLCDVVMVGSEFHGNRVYQKFGKKVVVTGAVWSASWIREKYGFSEPYQKIPNTVIYPHRPCREKGFDYFLQVAKSNPELRFIITTSGEPRIDAALLPGNVEYRYRLSKREYYQIFSQCEGYISTAFQETFGYTIQEAIFFKCKLICPNYACYPEFVLPDNLMELSEMVLPNAVTAKYQSLQRPCLQFPDNAKKIIELLRII